MKTRFAIAFLVLFALGDGHPGFSPANAAFWHTTKKTEPLPTPGPVVEVRPYGSPPKPSPSIWGQIGRAAAVGVIVQTIVRGAAFLIPVL